MTQEEARQRERDVSLTCTPGAFLMMRMRIGRLRFGCGVETLLYIEHTSDLCKGCQSM